jgi:hypothetical protein
MLLTNSRTIREVVLFPLLRTESAEQDAPPESQSASGGQPDVAAGTHFDTKQK